MTVPPFGAGFRFMIWIGVVILGLLDQVLKQWFLLNPEWLVSIDGPVRLYLQLYTNSAAAFSLPLPVWLVTGLSLVVIAGLTVLFLKTESRQLKIVLFVLLVGAFSNLIDRVRLGSVVDYVGIDIFGFRSSRFNIADLMILIGIVGWLLVGRRK